jgi:tetrahydromethanopterin S-methyltransferase subunit B
MVRITANVIMATSFQNTVNALLNFRAISQDCRPKWGSYPGRNLVNYLAGVLGMLHAQTPSGWSGCKNLN